MAGKPASKSAASPSAGQPTSRETCQTGASQPGSSQPALQQQKPGLQTTNDWQLEPLTTSLTCRFSSSSHTHTSLPICLSVHQSVGVLESEITDWSDRQVHGPWTMRAIQCTPDPKDPIRCSCSSYPLYWIIQFRIH